MIQPTLDTTMNHETRSSHTDHARKTTLGEMLSKNRVVQLLEIAIVFLPPSLVIIAFHIMSIDNPLLFIGGLWVANVLMIGLIWLGIKLRDDSWNSIGLTLVPTDISAVGWAVLKSIPIFVFAVIAFVIGSIVMANIVGIPDAADMNKLGSLLGNLPMLLISLLGVYVVSSFGEEVVYRGFLITRLEKLLPGKHRAAPITALILSSLVFGFAHFECHIPFSLAQ